MAALPQMSPFTRVVTQTMRTLYPEYLTDRSFDNTGLLLQAPWNRSRKQRSALLLTIDLTRAVATEAIEKGVDCIVAYHPIIYTGLKSLTFSNTQQFSLLRLAQEGISVYCPHTAVDSAKGGNADWLSDVVLGQSEQEVLDDGTAQDGGMRFGLRKSNYRLAQFPYVSRDTRQVQIPAKKIDAMRRPIVPTTLDSATGHGRFLDLKTPVPLLTLLSNLVAGLGSPSALSLALPYGTTLNSHDRIERIAVCVGSGGSVFSKIPSDDGVPLRQLYVTGEMSHHEALAATENGICLVCLGHSNSERGFLWNGMKVRLIEELKERWTEARREVAEARGFEEHVEVLVSRCDRDPFGTLVMEKRGE